MPPPEGSERLQGKRWRAIYPLHLFPCGPTLYLPQVNAWGILLWE